MVYMCSDLSGIKRHEELSVHLTRAKLKVDFYSTQSHSLGNIRNEVCTVSHCDNSNMLIVFDVAMGVPTP